MNFLIPFIEHPFASLFGLFLVGVILFFRHSSSKEMNEVWNNLEKENARQE